MQRRLLDATLSSLVEKGYRGTTTLEVQKRAGVSRGALLHHYGSRSELVLAAIDHVARERMDEVLALAKAQPPGSKRIAWAVRVLWSTFEGPLFAASLELWLAARTDEELLVALVPQEQVVGRAIRDMAGHLFGDDARDAAGFAEILEILLDAMRGAAARVVLRTEATDRRLLSAWTQLISDRVALAAHKA
jgi:AcrR family transcriptional regulator